MHLERSFANAKRIAYFRNWCLELPHMPRMSLIFNRGSWDGYNFGRCDMTWFNASRMRMRRKKGSLSISHYAIGAAEPKRDSIINSFLRLLTSSRAFAWAMNICWPKRRTPIHCATMLSCCPLSHSCNLRPSDDTIIPMLLYRVFHPSA